MQSTLFLLSLKFAWEKGEKLAKVIKLNYIFVICIILIMANFLDATSGTRFSLEAVEEENESSKNKAAVGESGTTATSADPPPSCPAATRTSPIVVLVIGMAGAGKTTLMHRINLSMNERGLRGYYVNLDPAVKTVPFAANIDIRDTVNYKEVMKQYGLGPNGGILTSLNLFATRFEQVINILERRAADLDYIFVDTPGQIEAFTWSAGGQIIHELLGTTFPTVILYIADTPRCVSPTTFMSNMLYACSILYKSRLPMICAFNKVDVVPCDFAEEWMNDFETYQAALDGDKGEEYMGTLNRSLSLVMDEFYKNIRTAGVSAATGQGMDVLFDKFDLAAAEFRETYLPDLERRAAQRRTLEVARQQKDLAKLRHDLTTSKGDRLVIDASSSSGGGSSSSRNRGERGGEGRSLDPEEEEEEEEDR